MNFKNASDNKYKNNNNKAINIKGTKRLALCSLLTAIALTIFIVEAQIPSPVPIPGVKLGLSNIVTLFALMYLGYRDALMILVARIILGGIFSSAPSVIPYSLCGGLLCIAGEMIMIKLLGKRFIAEISVFGAVLHNIGQLCCAALVIKSLTVFSYLPVLTICAVVCGAFCGLCVMFFDRRISHRINILK